MVPRPGIVGLTEGSCPHLRIRHDGYQGRLVTERDKLARNIAATLDLEQGSGDVSAREANLGRALAAAGRHAEAMPHLAAARTSGLERVRRLVLRYGAEVLINLGQPRESLDWIDELRRTSSHRGIADYLEGRARLNLGQLGEATRLFDGVGELRDEDGFTLSIGWLHARHGLTLAARGRWDEAVDALLAAVAQRGTAAQPVWALLAQAVAEANRGLDEAVAAVRNAELTTVLGQLLNSQPEAADAFAEALWARWPADPHLFAAAIRLAPALPLLRALECAARLRLAGLAERCPLITIARDEAVDPIRRISAACVAAATFGDPTGAAAVATLAADLVSLQPTFALFPRHADQGPRMGD